MINIAIIGAGNWGKNIVRNFAALDDVNLRYVADLDEDVRRSMQHHYPDACVTDDVDEALSDPDVDAAVIAVSAEHHYRLAMQAIRAGKHTYVEKPLTLDAREGQELLQEAERNGVKLMVGHLLEYHPAVEYMKEAIAGGEVGDPLYLYFQRVNLGIIRKAENAWWSLAPHDVSVACYLFGAEPVSVSASGHDYLQEGIEDVVFANLKFADGKMAHIHVSWLDPHKIRKVTLVGSQKMVVFDDMEAAEKVRVYDKGADVQTSVDSYAEAITLRTGDILIPRIPRTEPLRVECQHFVDCIAEDKTPRSDGNDGLRVVKVLQAGSESLKQQGQPIAIRTEPCTSPHRVT